MKITEKLKQMYLDYLNNFITVARFAEHYNVTEEEALVIINAGRSLNEL